MSKIHSLTNEKLLKKFSNPFNLVNYAIKLAEYQIQLDKDSNNIQSQNLAEDLLEIIGTRQDFNSTDQEVATAWIEKEKILLSEALNGRDLEKVEEELSTEKPRRKKKNNSAED